jgi:hypothetical protein
MLNRTRKIGQAKVGYAGQVRQNRALAFPPCRVALGSKTRFPVWVGEKARIRAFLLSRSALSLFFALFFFALLRSYFAFALASAKARKKRRRPPLIILQDTTNYLIHSDRHRSFEVLFKSDRKEFKALILSELAPLATFAALPFATKSFLKRLEFKKKVCLKRYFLYFFVFFRVHVRATMMRTSTWTFTFQAFANMIARCSTELAI